MSKLMPWYLTGRIGRFLNALRDDGETGSHYIRKDNWLIVGRDGKNYIHLTLRGNSKQRR